MPNKLSIAPLPLVLMITELEVGGAERNLTRLAVHLDRRRFHPSVISLAPLPSRNRQLLVELEQAQVPVYSLNVRRSWQMPWAWWRLRKLVRSVRPVLVQSFLFHANVLAACAVPKSIPVILGIRVADPRRGRMRLERFAARRARVVVCVSQSVRDFAVHTAKLPDDRLCVIPNGIEIDLGEEASTMEQVPGDRRVLLWVGRLDYQKGLDWLLNMADTILQQCPEHDLVLAGTGPEMERVTIWKSTSPVGNRLHAIGWREDVRSLLRRADGLLLPSRWEGMPNVVLEAMAAALPVVATRVEGVAEVLGPGADEQTVPFGDSEAFIGKVVRLAHDASWRAAWGEANRARVVDQFTIESMIESYQKLYDRILSERRK